MAVSKELDVVQVVVHYNHNGQHKKLTFTGNTGFPKALSLYFDEDEMRAAQDCMGVNSETEQAAGVAWAIQDGAIVCEDAGSAIAGTPLGHSVCWHHDNCDWICLS